MNRLDLAAPREGQMPIVCIFSTWNEAYQPIADIAIPNFRAYAKRHGYACRMFPNEFHLDPARPETYGDKIKHTLYYDIGGHCHLAMWLDIDSLFMNHDIRIEDVAGFNPFTWTYDDNGPLSGLWIAKTDPMTEKHLRYAYEMAVRENNVRHGKIEPNGISDQDAMTRLMGMPPFNRTFSTGCYPAAELGHCYESNYEPGKWIITFPGMSVEEKLEKMTQWATKAN